MSVGKGTVRLPMKEFLDADEHKGVDGSRILTAPLTARAREASTVD